MTESTDRTSGRLIASSTLWQIASQITMAALSIITVKFVAIGLSKELAGNYNSAYGYLQIFGILADFGLYAVAVREVSRAPAHSAAHGKHDQAEVMGALIMLRIIITALSLGSALLFAWILPVWRDTPLPLGITIAAFVPFFTLLAGIQRTIFQVRYTMHYVFIAEVLQRIVAVGLIAVFIAMGVRESYDLWAYHYFLLAGSAGAFVLFVLSTVFARRLLRVKLQWQPQLLKILFLQAAPYGLAFLCTALYRQLDVTLIALLRDDYEAQNAYYGFALRAVEMGYLIPTFLLNSTLPALSERDAKGEDTGALVGKILFAILLVGSAMALFAGLWGRPLMLLLTRPEYVSGAGLAAGADTALTLLAIPMFLNGIVLFSFYSLLTRHAWQPLVTTLALGAFLSIALNVLFIPRWGFVGSAMSSIATNCFLAITLFIQSRRILPIRFDAVLLKRWLLFSLLLGLFLLAVRPLLTSDLATALLLALAGIYLLILAQVTGIRHILGHSR